MHVAGSWGRREARGVDSRPYPFTQGGHSSQHDGCDHIFVLRFLTVKFLNVRIHHDLFNKHVKCFHFFTLVNNASAKCLQKNLCPWREILRSGPCRPSGPVGHAPS